MFWPNFWGAGGLRGGTPSRDGHLPQQGPKTPILHSPGSPAPGSHAHTDPTPLTSHGREQDSWTATRTWDIVGALAWTGRNVRPGGRHAPGCQLSRNSLGSKAPRALPPRPLLHPGASKTRVLGERGGQAAKDSAGWGRRERPRVLQVPPGGRVAGWPCLCA